MRCLPLFLLLAAFANAQDTIPPVITLIGDSIVCVAIDSQYTDPEVTISDNHTSEEDMAITTAGDFVSTERQGRFCICYTAEDSSGNQSGTKCRTICVGLDKDACRALPGKWCGAVTGVPKTSVIQLSVFPNPSNGIVQVKSDYIIGQIEVFNVSGILVLRQSPKNREAKIKINRPGLYFLSVHGEKGSSKEIIAIEP